MVEPEVNADYLRLLIERLHSIWYDTHYDHSSAEFQVEVSALVQSLYEKREWVK